MSENMMDEKVETTVYSETFKKNFGFFGGGAFLYSCLYAFCLFRNPSGVTFPFFYRRKSLLFLLMYEKVRDFHKKRQYLLHGRHGDFGDFYRVHGR